MPAATPKTPYDYGAVGDGVADDTAALQAWIYGAVELDANVGKYKTTYPLILPQNKNIRGLGERSTFIHTGSTDLFQITGGNIYIDKIKVDASLSTGGYTFKIDSTVAGLERIRISNVTTVSSYGLVTDIPTANYPIINLKMVGVHARAHKGRGVNLSKAFAYLKMQDVVVDSVSVPHNLPLFTVKNNQGCHFIDCHAAATGGSAGQHGFYFDSCEAVWMWGCQGDSVAGTGIYVKGGQYHYLTNAVASLCSGPGIKFESTNKSMLTGCFTEGNGTAGLVQTSTTSLTTANCQFN